MPVSRFLVGESYEFDYPRHNFHGVKTHFERRRIVVTDVRDLMQQPLDPMTGDEQPLLRRGRYLVTGQDLDKHAERSFYVDSMANVTPLRNELQTA